MGKILIVFCGFVALLSLLLWFCLMSLPDGKLRVWILDVGQGDSILIETPEQQFILVDGGPDDSALQQVSGHLPFFVHTLDVVILTHPHADHLAGLLPIFERYKVGRLILTGVDYKSGLYDAMWRVVQENHISFSLVKLGEDYRLGSVLLDIIYPFSSLQGQTFRDLNNSSLVFRLIFGGQIFMFTGDLEVEKEQLLIASGLHLHADFLKTGHHGSKTSSSEDFLEAIRPQMAFISCGVNNIFHHPFPATVERYLMKKITLYRTDLDGTIDVILDGIHSQVKTEGKT